MAFKVSLLPEAQQEYEEALEWYEKQKPGLGFRLYLEMEQTIGQIGDNSTYYTSLSGEYRDVALKTFPYRIIFAVRPTEVVVFAIFHTRRSEEEIYKRLP